MSTDRIAHLRTASDCPLCGPQGYAGMHETGCPNTDLDAIGYPLALQTQETGLVTEPCDICWNAATLRFENRGEQPGWLPDPIEKPEGEPCPRCGNNDQQGTHRFIGPTRPQLVFTMADESAFPTPGKFRFWMHKPKHEDPASAPVHMAPRLSLVDTRAAHAGPAKGPRKGSARRSA